MANADRPAVPRSYGIEPVTKGRLVQWESAQAKLAAARNYWVATSSRSGAPHSAPVWGIWHDAAFFFGTDPKSRKGRNLASNSAAVVHLESGDDVVIVEGTISKLAAKEITPELDGAYAKKYGIPLKGNSVFKLAPKRAFAWSETDFPMSATRWRF